MSVAAFDLDGTLLEQNSSFSFCRYLYKRCLFTKADLLCCFALYFRHLFLGLSLKRLHTHAFKSLFHGKSVVELSMHIEPFIQTLKWYPLVLTRLHQLREKGFEIYILSSSPLFLVRPIAASIGVGQVRATDYEVDEAGRLLKIATLIDGKEKAKVLQSIKDQTIAFSDSHHDIPFLESASQAIVVNPTRSLYKIAKKHHWEILNS